MKDIIKRIIQFNKDRNWSQFHSGSNLAKSICIEAGELLELFQWNEEASDIEELKDELADVFIYSIMIAEKYDLDIKEMINSKIAKNELKYPINKAFGKSKKYNKF